LDWLQKELEDRTGIKLRTIQEIERGSKKGLKLSRRNAQRISAVTGVNVDCLVDGDDWPADREIINTSGKRWSEKDAKAIKRSNEGWPGAEAVVASLQAEFHRQLLLDHFFLRCLLLATPDPSEALDDWRWHRERAWTQFQKDYPTAKIGKDLEWPEGRKVLETIRQDIDLVSAHEDPIQGRAKELLRALIFGEAQIKLGDKIADSFLGQFPGPGWFLTKKGPGLIITKRKPTKRELAKREPDTFWGELTPFAKMRQEMEKAKSKRTRQTGEPPKIT
jgi:transcriptional regulator with XRE-family HTH domain